MKRLLMVILLLIGLVGCDQLNRTPEEREMLHRQQQMDRMTKVMGRMVYFQDNRPHPPICYAYFWEGNNQGGPAITAVDCASVEQLLVGRVSVHQE